MSQHLNSKSQATYNHIFQHPITHNLEWGDVRSLFETMGDVEQEHNGKLSVTISGETRVFQAKASNHIATADEVMDVRHFLEFVTTPELPADERHFLVLIDNLVAKIYRTELKGSEPHVLKAHYGKGTRGEVHNPHDLIEGQEKHKLEPFFKAIALELHDAEKVLVAGSGSGSSSARELFYKWIQEHDKPLFAKVFKVVTIDQSHVSENELLAVARMVYETQDTMDQALAAADTLAAGS